MGWFGESDEDLSFRYWKGVRAMIEINWDAYINIVNQWNEEVCETTSLPKKYDPKTSREEVDRKTGPRFNGQFRSAIFAIEIGMIKVHEKKGDDKRILDIFERTCIELARHEDEDGKYPMLSKEKAKQLMEKNNYASNIHKALIDKNISELAELYFVALEECIKDITKGKNKKVWMPTAMATAVKMAEAVDQDWG